MKKEIKTFVRPIDWLGTVETGWGNGYAIIPKDHPYYGKDYDDIPISVHGGLTFGDPAKNCNWEECPENKGFVIGFDCAHSGDSLANWDKDAVIVETDRLKEQLEKLWT